MFGELEAGVAPDSKVAVPTQIVRWTLTKPNCHEKVLKNCA